MSLALTISDNADGSGGVASIVGSDSGSANTLYRALYSALVAPQFGWTATGTRSGDGTIAVAPGNGLYFWYATGTVGGNPAVSPVVYQQLSDQTTAVHYRCLQSYQSGIQGLNLLALKAQNVQFAWTIDLAFNLVNAKPCVLIAPVGTEGQPGVLSGKDDVEYPVLVVIVDAMDGPTAHLPRDLLWRQRIFRHFRNQRLAGVPEIITTPVETRPVLDPQKWQASLWWSALLFKPRSREVRG